MPLEGGKAQLTAVALDPILIPVPTVELPPLTSGRSLWGSFRRLYCIEQCFGTDSAPKSRALCVQ